MEREPADVLELKPRIDPPGELPERFPPGNVAGGEEPDPVNPRSRDERGD
jgi:hypothetical protein